MKIKEYNFLPAQEKHLTVISELIHSRHPSMEKEKILTRTKNEINELHNDKTYGLYVAEKNGQFLGLCRFFASNTVPKEKIQFDSPDGLYCMGILVEPKYRNKGVARFLSHKREELLKKNGVKMVYSMVACDNPPSLAMHKSFGFTEVTRAPGFMMVKFDCGEGILFQKKL